MCAMEARAAGLKPVAVSHLATTPSETVSGAAAKRERALDSTLGHENTPRHPPFEMRRSGASAVILTRPRENHGGTNG
jgi:hypothetical protein